MSAPTGKVPWTLPAFWAAGIASAGVLAWLWPRMVTVRGDDFGYLESVVLTVQQARPVSSDWLEPFNRVLPTLSAATWWCTHNFYVSTLGVLAATVAGVFVLAWRWLRPALPAGWPGHLTFCALALCPVWLNKAVEFTGIPLGLLLFLGALGAWRASRPVLFHFLVLVAVLNRQSAVCLLALPAWSWWNAWRRREHPDRLAAGGLVVASAAIVLLVALLPDNVARSLAAQRLAHREWLGVGAQLLLGLVLLGGMAAFWALLRGEPVGAARHGADLGIAAGWLLAGATLSVAGVSLQCETPLLARAGMFLVPVAALLAALVPRACLRVPPGMLAAAGLYAALVAWRGIWWDYYLLEPALLLAGGHVPSVSRPNPVRARVIAIAVFLVMLPGVPPIRYQVRWTEHAVVTYESLLRGGRVGIREASGAPFGFLGWKLFPVACGAPERMTGLTDFLGYVEAGRSRLAGEGVLLFDSTLPVRSLQPSGELRGLPAGYRDRRFPLDNGEWRDLLGSRIP